MGVKDGDLIWVHDYHLMLLPQMLRRRFDVLGNINLFSFSIYFEYRSKCENRMVLAYTVSK